MGERNRRTVILVFLMALPTLAVIGPRLPSVQGPVSAAPEVVPMPGAIRGGVRQTAAPLSRADQEAWFRRVRQQLLDLGAVYMRLERWNGACPVYQFRCDLRQGPRSGDQTSIEALSGSAEAAADYVLLAARRWSQRVHSAEGSLHPFPAIGEPSAESRSESDLPLGRLRSPGGIDRMPHAGLTPGQPLN